MRIRSKYDMKQNNHSNKQNQIISQQDQNAKFTVGDSNPGSLGKSSPLVSNDISPMESLKFCKVQISINFV